MAVAAAVATDMVVMVTVVTVTVVMVMVTVVTDIMDMVVTRIMATVMHIMVMVMVTCTDMAMDATGTVAGTDMAWVHAGDGRPLAMFGFAVTENASEEGGIAFPLLMPATANRWALFVQLLWPRHHSATRSLLVLSFTGYASLTS
jgi:hypothetical protein